MKTTQLRSSLVARGLIAASLLLPGWLIAASLYQAGVPVAGTGVEARNQAIGEAVKSVVVKVSGRRNAGDDTALKALAGEAPALVQQYRYETSTGSEDTAERRLQVRFDESSLRQAMGKYGIPVWAGTRPSTLLWLGIDSSKGRRFLQAETDSTVTDALQRAAEQRGLPLLFPLLDMEDFSRVSPSDLWGGFDERLEQASSRYDADLILVGRLGKTGSGWQVQWRLLDPQGNQEWRSQAADAGLAATAGLQEAADRIAQRYAPTAMAVAGDTTLVQVLGVRDLQTLKSVETLFSSLDAVQASALTRVEPDSIWLSLNLAGAPDAVARGATLGGTLTLAPARPEPPTTGGATMPTTPLPDLIFQVRR